MLLRESLACVVALALFASCSETRISLPAEKSDFGGRWEAGASWLEIRANGDIEYSLIGDGESHALQNGFLVSFSDTLIKYSPFGESTISAAPYEKAGNLAIRIDDHELFKVD